MAPELLEDKPYDGVKVDVFNLGIILFAMIMRNYPFGCNDTYYV
jgi:serine/threonine protein kinase